MIHTIYYSKVAVRHHLCVGGAGEEEAQDVVMVAHDKDKVPYSTKLWWEKTLADLVVHCQSTKVLSTKSCEVS